MTKEFITAALPWVLTGIGLAVLFVSLYANRKNGKKSNDNEENYGVPGLHLGRYLNI